ncbi:MAG: CatA-like O-acetyltransferase [Pseudomonadota bacterium]
MSLKNVVITDIAEFDEVDVVEILVKEGDEILVDQPLLTIESEKAMMDYPSPYAGVVEKIMVQEGNKISDGDTLLALKVINESSTQLEENSQSNVVLENTEQGVEDENQALDKKIKSFVTRSPSANSKAYATPGTQKYARELGVNLGDVQGTGRKQRILTEDVQQHVREQLQAPPMKLHQHNKKLDFENYGVVSEKELTKIQKLTAENMLNAWQTIPHVTHFDQADVTQLEQHRKKLKAELKEKKINLTPLAFIIKALVIALKQYPQFNSSIDLATDKLIFKNFFHIGIAVDTEHGLFVPVLREANKKSLQFIAQELVVLSELARQRKLTPQHMGGASMTISSLGNLGGQAFTPIINPPEVAILGLSKMINENEKKILPLSLSYDHRVINGADAARFCTYLKSILEDVWKLIL